MNKNMSLPILPPILLPKILLSPQNFKSYMKGVKDLCHIFNSDLYSSRIQQLEQFNQVQDPINKQDSVKKRSPSKKGSQNIRQRNIFTSNISNFGRIYEHEFNIDNSKYQRLTKFGFTYKKKKLIIDCQPKQEGKKQTQITILNEIKKEVDIRTQFELEFQINGLVYKGGFYSMILQAQLLDHSHQTPIQNSSDEKRMQVNLNFTQLQEICGLTQRSLDTLLEKYVSFDFTKNQLNCQFDNFIVDKSNQKCEQEYELNYSNKVQKDQVEIEVINPQIKVKVDSLNYTQSINCTSQQIIELINHNFASLQQIIEKQIDKNKITQLQQEKTLIDENKIKSKEEDNDLPQLTSFGQNDLKNIQKIQAHIKGNFARKALIKKAPVKPEIKEIKKIEDIQVIQESKEENTPQAKEQKDTQDQKVVEQITNQ